MFMIRLLVKAVVAVVVLVVVAGVAAYALGYWQAGGAVTMPTPDVAAGRETAREVGAAVADKTRDLSARDLMTFLPPDGPGAAPARRRW